MSINESTILRLASIIQDAVALGQAVLDGDAAEARLRADQVFLHASEARLDGVAHAALIVIDCLRPVGHSTGQTCGSAIKALSIEIDRAQTHQLT